jgi:hypothetical protein
MLQKFKITTCAFILCLFGLTLMTVSPVFAQAETQKLEPSCNDARDATQRDICFRELARILGGSQPPATDPNTNEQSQPTGTTTEEYMAAIRTMHAAAEQDHERLSCVSRIVDDMDRAARALECRGPRQEITGGVADAVGTRVSRNQAELYGWRDACMGSIYGSTNACVNYRNLQERLDQAGFGVDVICEPPYTEFDLTQQAVLDGGLRSDADVAPTAENSRMTSLLRNVEVGAWVEHWAPRWAECDTTGNAPRLFPRHIPGSGRGVIIPR